MDASFLLRALPSVRRHRGALLLAGGAGLCFARLASEMREGELDALDAVIARAVDSLRGPILDPVMTALTTLGGEVVMSCVGVGVFAALMLARRWRAARFFAIGSGGGIALNVALKLLFHRPRPDASLRYLVSTTSLSSFPSGHTMGTAAVCASLVVLSARHCRRELTAFYAVLGALLVFGVGVSRVYLGAHFPSDVVGALLAALAWIAIVKTLLLDDPVG